MEEKSSTKRYVSRILGVSLFVLFLFLPAPEELAAAAASHGYDGRTAMTVIGALLFAICWWVGSVVPDWCTALILQLMWVIAAGMDFSLVFAAFSNTTVWLMIGAFSLGAAVTGTGLLKRISLKLMRLFPATFRGQVLALMTAGTVCGPLMPSTTAKVVLGSKLAYGSAELMGYGSRTKGRSGLFLAAWTGFDLTAPMFISASFLGYSMAASLPGKLQDVSWMQWFIAMLPWGVLIFIAMFLVITLICRPEKNVSFSGKEIASKAEALGPVSKNEKITGVIVCLCLVFWILEKVTGISAGAVALAGAVLCFAFRVLDSKDIKNLPWGFIIFVGVVLNMGEMFVSTGISDWLTTMIGPVMKQIDNQVLIVAMVFVITVAMRFAIASQTAVITILTSLFAPLVLAAGISPFAAGLVVYTAVPVWIAYYQNPTYLAAMECMDGTVKHGDTLKAAFIYIGVALLADLAVIPYWMILGYL